MPVGSLVSMETLLLSLQQDELKLVCVCWCNIGYQLCTRLVYPRKPAAQLTPASSSRILPANERPTVRTSNAAGDARSGLLILADVTMRLVFGAGVSTQSAN